MFNYGRTREGLIALWVGEGDPPTSDFIRDGAKAALDRGETFYTYQRGIPDCAKRSPLCVGRLWRCPRRHAPEQFLRHDRRHAGDPDGGAAHRRPRRRGAGALAELAEFRRRDPAAGARAAFRAARRGRPGASTSSGSPPAIRRDTRVFINTPANPTGCVATARNSSRSSPSPRDRGLWIIADEIYGRLTYDGGRAPSFQTSWRRTTGSSSSRHFPRTGR